MSSLQSQLRAMGAFLRCCENKNQQNKTREKKTIKKGFKCFSNNAGFVSKRSSNQRGLNACSSLQSTAQWPLSTTGRWQYSLALNKEKRGGSKEERVICIWTHTWLAYALGGEWWKVVGVEGGLKGKGQNTGFLRRCNETATQKFTFTSPEKCRPLTLSANVQAELQTIPSIMFLLFYLFFKRCGIWHKTIQKDNQK